MYVKDWQKAVEINQVPKRCHDCGRAILPGEPFRDITDENGEKKSVHSQNCPG